MLPVEPELVEDEDVVPDVTWVEVGDAVDAEVALEEPDRRDVTATAVRAVA